MGFPVLTKEQVKQVAARYQRAPGHELSLLPPEPPFGARRLIEVDTRRMLDPDADPSDYARQVITLYDPAEAERYAHVQSDVRLLCEMALLLYEQIEAAGL